MSDKKHITVCRVAYCEECYKNHRPSKQDIFCTIGRTHQKYTVRVVEYWGTRGFTPHIITITSIEQDKVIFTSYCAIHGCGCNISYNENTEKYLIQPINYTTMAIERMSASHFILSFAHCIAGIKSTADLCKNASAGFGLPGLT